MRDRTDQKKLPALDTSHTVILAIASVFLYLFHMWKYTNLIKSRILCYFTAWLPFCWVWKRFLPFRPCSLFMVLPMSTAFHSKSYVPRLSRGCPRKTSWRPYNPICNAKRRDCSRTYLGLAQDVNLTIIPKMGFYWIFSIFSDSNCILGVALLK